MRRRGRHNEGVKITMLLADAAQEVQGKLYVLGGGWSTTRSPAPPIGRPTGLPEGTPLDAPLVVSFGPLPLQPGRYEWRLEIEEWVETCAFLVRG
jgi:hypothetical protein